ncbi:MAG TPA: glutamyl-tRNA reductase [Candidatus Tenderia sp.]|nr:glutamyl-tRNA reductase [Candidatus Tenderia sp.]
MNELKSLPGISEASVLSTCNRTEVTCWHNSEDATQTVIDWIAQRHDFHPDSLSEYLFIHNDDEAVRHMLRVACGLDSLVLGEPQILGQLKTAFQAAKSNNGLGRYLGRLYQHSFTTAKQIRTETEIGSSAVSVAFAAVGLAKKIYGDLRNHTALMIGAGETIELATRHLDSQGIGKLIVANRTVERAAKLASEFGGTAIALPDLPDRLPEADIVVSSTASPLPILGKGTVERALKQRKRRPIFMVDIAVPRDIEPEVGELSDIYLYTVDDLQDVIEQNMKSRQQAAEKAEELVDAHVEVFTGWLNSQDAVETIRHFRSQAKSTSDQVAQQAKRLLRQGKNPEEVIDYLSHTLTNKLLHAPTSTLNQAAREGRNELLEAALEIFQLNTAKKT